MLKISGGRLRGKKIVTPPATITRPMLNYIKQIIFNQLRTLTVLRNCVVLDLFAGSGQLGLEALSQGAGLCIFNDVNPTVIDVLKSNLQMLPKQHYELHHKPFAVMLHQCSVKQQKFNLIFLDPPFAANHLTKEALLLIKRYNLLLATGVVVIEQNIALADNLLEN